MGAASLGMGRRGGAGILGRWQGGCVAQGMGRRGGAGILGQWQGGCVAQGMGRRGVERSSRKRGGRRGAGGGGWCMMGREKGKCLSTGWKDEKWGIDWLIFSPEKPGPKLLRSDVFQWRQQMLVCEGGTTVPRRRWARLQGVFQRREALNQSRPCSDGERSDGSTIQGQGCRQLGTTRVGEGSELVAGVDVTHTKVSEAGVEGAHDWGRQATSREGLIKMGPQSAMLSKGSCAQ